MTRKTTRRSFVAAAGAAGVALAGCIGSPGEGGGRTTDGTTTGSTNTTERDRTTTTVTAEADVPFSRGELLADFEDAEAARWGAVTGTVTPDTEEVYAGTQSLRLEHGGKNAVGVYRSFPEGLDLTSHDLSLAVKMEEPQAGKVALEVLAPGRSDHLVSKRYIPQEMNGWTRVDFGYTGKRGDPIMDAVQEVRLVVQTGGAPIRVWVDDLRMIPKAGNGKVVFQFDDSLLSTYDVVLPEFQRRGWAGGVGVIPRSVNSEGNLTDGMMREMRDAGWDMMSHPQEPEPLPSFSPDEQRRLIEDAKKYLELKGFPEGAKHFIAPYNRVDEDTLRILKEIGHETAFMYGACPSNARHTSAPLFISRVNGRDPRGTRRVLNLAAEHDQLVTIAYHDIAAEGEESSGDLTVAWEDFQNVLDHVEETGLDVVTPTELAANW